jgi:hypothetical protein
MAWFDDITKKSEDFGPQHSLTSFQSQNTLFPFTRKSLGFRLWNRKNCSIPIQPSLHRQLACGSAAAALFATLSTWDAGLIL